MEWTGHLRGVQNWRQKGARWFWQRVSYGGSSIRRNTQIFAAENLFLSWYLDIKRSQKEENCKSALWTLFYHQHMLSPSLDCDWGSTSVQTVPSFKWCEDHFQQTLVLSLTRYKVATEPIICDWIEHFMHIYLLCWNCRAALKSRLLSSVWTKTTYHKQIDCGRKLGLQT